MYIPNPMYKAVFPCPSCRYYQKPVAEPRGMCPRSDPVYGKCLMFGTINMLGGQIHYDYAINTYDVHCHGKYYSRVDIDTIDTTKTDGTA